MMIAKSNLRINMNDWGVPYLGGSHLGAHFRSCELQEGKTRAYLNCITRAFPKLGSSPSIREAAFSMGHSEHMNSHSRPMLLTTHSLEGREVFFSITLMAQARFYGILQADSPEHGSKHGGVAPEFCGSKHRPKGSKHKAWHTWALHLHTPASTRTCIYTTQGGENEYSGQI